MADTYQDWARWLDAFARGTEPAGTGLAVISSDNMHESVMIGLQRRVVLSFGQRLELWQQTLHRDLGGSLTTYGISGLEPALARARIGLGPLLELVHSPLLPTQWRAALSAVLRESVGGVQRDLEQQARGPNAGRLREVITYGSLLAAVGGTDG